MPKPKRKHTCDFYEDEIPVVLQSLIDRISFRDPNLVIRKFGNRQERNTGADAQIGRDANICPFYMQFKRPSAWDGDAEDAVIVADRLRLSLETTPQSLFFELRRKASHHEDFQHNMLFKLRESLSGNGIGDAAYVCPLFMEFSKYREHMPAGDCGWEIRAGLPWINQTIGIYDPLMSRSDFNAVPVFSRHVSIPPHKLVENHKHSYSFRPDGQQVCFHSPEEVKDDTYLLSDWLNKLYDTPQNLWLREDSARRMLENLLLALDLSDNQRPDLFTGEHWIESWIKFGSFLTRTYDIHQFVFLHF